MRSEIDRIKANNNNIIFDIDVRGGINIKNQFGDDALAVFVMPPSIEDLYKRLEKRGTDSEKKIQKRLEKAKYEMRFANKFDHTIINENLEQALKKAEEIVREFLKN